MQLKQIYIGSWFPKTNMHLKELEMFLMEKKVVEGLDPIPGKSLHRNLNPQNTASHTNSDGMKHIHAESSGFNFTYYGDGLLVVNRPIEKSELVERYSTDMVQFYREKLAPILTYIFSRGAKDLEIIRPPGSKKTIFFNSEGNTSAEIHDFFRSLGQEIHSINNYKESTAYYGEDVILLNCNGDSSHHDCDNIISHLILFNDVKKHSHRLLQTHREVWDEADRIISESKIRVKDLPHYNEILTDFSNKIDNISARIDLMKLNFGYRKSKAKEDNLLFAKIWPNFSNLEQNLDYVKNLYGMTQHHLQNNISRISSIYQENQENALNKLQLLFLLSVVSGFVSLGSYMLQDPDIPHELTNNFIGFDLRTLITFGSTSLIITVIVYYLWNYTFQNVKTKLKK